MQNARVPAFTAILLGLSLLSGGSSHAQQPLRITGPYCAFDGSPLAAELYQFTSDQAAERALERVMRYTGLTQNFIIRAANVDANGAVAYIDRDSNQRVILYGQRFMMEIEAATSTDWSKISILAHEVGHHLQGHTLLPGGSRPPTELEADRFSGFILQRMGATLEESQAAMKRLASPEGSATHPGRDARLTAITNGWVESRDLAMSPAPRTETRPVPAPAPAPPTPAPSAGRLNYELAPAYGEVSLRAGFEPDPHQVEVTSGGDVDTTYIGNGCRGFAARAPDFRVKWSGSSQRLRIMFRTDGSGDTTLLVNLPDGSWRCNDDANDHTLRPMVSVNQPKAGTFDIWVGSYTKNDDVRGTLIVTERDVEP